MSTRIRFGPVSSAGAVGFGSAASTGAVAVAVVAVGVAWFANSQQATGNSAAPASSFGPLIARGSHDQEEVLLVDCDLGRIEETRRHWPFLRDRRIDAYGGITQRFLD